MSRLHTGRRTAIGVVGLATGLGSVLAAAPAQAVVGADAAPAVVSIAAQDAGPQRAATAWLADQLTDGIAVTAFDGGTFQDYGLTVDIARALVAGGDATASGRALDALAENVDGYTRPGSGTVVSAGGTAKLAVLVQEGGRSTASFGGRDLIEQLEERVGAEGPTAGRITDQLDPEVSWAEDYANVFGQAYAVDALEQAGSDATSSATAFLLQQQCASGAFRLYFSAPDAADQSCDAAPADQRTPSVDATALALLALVEQVQTPAVDDAVTEAVAWLRSIQTSTGAFDDGDLIAANSNSTGLAARALAEVGETTGDAALLRSARDAAVWLRQRQVAESSGCGTNLRLQQGAVAYDAAALTRGRAVGIDPVASQYQWRLSTAQAAPALAWAPAATGALRLRATGAFVKAGTRTTVAIDGLAPGETVCVVGGRTPISTTAGRVAVTTPAGTARRTLTARTRTGSSSAQLTVLDRRALRVSAPARVRAGTAATVRASGLVAGERYSVSYRGAVRARGTVPSSGIVAVRLSVGNAAGRYGVRVSGQFADRTGTTSLTVVR